ncbi:phosphotransferase [Moelleriella libera RCEF 2490]|uniref:Phosphotransferase n=1 Tax=Moelleriella libera RCEF 2490 TaxID=1081109 RepID=A0A168CLS7_9HYPO|nr:phosphotransferase [Moelleriella libera RCEF 2490]
MDCIPGRSLDRNIYLNATEEQRRRLFQDLIKAMSELRRLEFSVAGSLMSKDGDVLSPTIGNALSISANELQRYGKAYGDAGPFSTAKECGCRLESIMSEMFAVDSVSEQTMKMLDPLWNHGPFILAHQDLRHNNIIIDEDDFSIKGVIDWEFTGTVPRQLFTPPPWITGHDCEGMDESKQDLFRSQFYQQLEAASRSSADSARLKEDWDTHTKETLAVAQILRRPSTLEDVYYKFIFPTLFDVDAKQVISEASQRDSFSIEAGNRLEESQRYTKYLSDRGLLNK